MVEEVVDLELEFVVRSSTWRVTRRPSSLQSIANLKPEHWIAAVLIENKACDNCQDAKNKKEFNLRPRPLSAAFVVTRRREV